MEQRSNKSGPNREGQVWASPHFEIPYLFVSAETGVVSNGVQGE